MASTIYNRFKANLMNKVVDLEADTIYVNLYDTNETGTVTDTDYSTTNELADGVGNYNRGANADNLLAGKAVTEAATTKWDATDHVWTGMTISAYSAIIWDDTAGDDLICFVDFGGEQTVTSGTFTIQWSTAGIVTMS